MLAWAWAPGDALAQVNVEALRPSRQKAGWGGEVDGNLALVRGNIRLFDLGGSGRLIYQTLHNQDVAVPYFKQRVFLAISGRFAENATATFINQGFSHLRWTWMIHPRIGPEVFLQYQFNQFLRLRTRTLAGGGLRMEFLHLDQLQSWAGSGYMYEYNLLNRDQLVRGATDPLETYEHRWTSYLAVRAAFLDDRLRLQNTLYIQPRFDRLSDFRLLNDSEVLARVTESFSLGSTFSVLHDSAPPTSVLPTDLRLASTLRLSF
ncbi:MAG: DUF481 domain-containing protein [Myxococcales bacterium]|nr:DUF481 domain-containing protein [Polyangiaceae bacterium]MDW8248332.1 DUF481 domain-containing protein [Myxococcales bacterium]